MKKIFSLISLSVILLSCQKEEEAVKQRASGIEYSKEQIDQTINNYLRQKNEFKWNFVSADFVAGALAEGDSLLAVGYKPEHISDIKDFSVVNIKSPEWIKAKEATLLKILVELKKTDRSASLKDFFVKEDETLPFFVIKTTSVNVVQKLREIATARYAEPLGYPFGKETTKATHRTFGKLGCSNEPDPISSSDYIPYSPGTKVSWNYRYMNIPQAWEHSTGQNVVVAIIDTGTSPDQENLGSAINQGESNGRTIEKYGTFKSSIWPWDGPDGPNDRCGHGTQMEGVFGAPRGVDSAAVGVAYNSDLVAIRGTGDVVIETSSEQYGVIDALKLAANHADVKIISMSIGTPLWSSSVADAVRYAYGKQKLIFAAAGTTTSITTWIGVVFPASMAEIVAVTGTIEGRFQRCDNCHEGEKVDFTIVMERNNSSGRNPLTLANRGDRPSTIGGSSVATATTAGIAALVWATDPNMSRAQVLDRLKRAAELYPNRNKNLGWGTIDALEAVAGNNL